jgi:uncharacterized repeat protein (TIGR03803 family)
MDMDGGNFKNLINFSNTNGSEPSTLTSVDSVLYGTTLSGGLLRLGTIYSIHTDGADFRLLQEFSGEFNSGNGARPNGDLLQIGTKLYGTAQAGGSGIGTGVVYSIELDGSNYQVLHSFSGSAHGDGGEPRGGLTVLDSKLYGTTWNGGPSLDGIGNGTVFSMNLDGSNYQILHTFKGGSAEGANPISTLTRVGNSLFGTTQYGGPSNNGTVFMITVPEPRAYLLALLGSFVLAATCALKRRNRR